MGTQTRVERILLENDEHFPGDLLLLSSQLSEITPERTGRPETILHLSPE
jgi:hypothetical protein